MGVGQLSESDAVDALRLPFYSSSHPTGSHIGIPNLILTCMYLPIDQEKQQLINPVIIDCVRTCARAHLCRRRWLQV